MLLDGATNTEMLTALRKAFGQDVPATYPAWYRSYAVKLGHITKEWAVQRRGPAIRAEG